LTCETREDNLENNNWKTQSLMNSMLKDQIDIKIALNKKKASKLKSTNQTTQVMH
jgi:hypothetical protein